MVMKVKFATVVRASNIERHCEFCSHQYQFLAECQRSDNSYSWHGGDPADVAAKMADGTLAKFQKNVSFGALCPSCHRFSSSFAKKYFPDGSFREGLVKAAVDENSLGLGCSCFFWVLFTSPLFFGLALAFSQATTIGGILICLLLSAATITGIWLLWRQSQRKRQKEMAQLRKTLAPLTDEMISTVISKEYEFWMNEQRDQTGFYRASEDPLPPFWQWPERWKTLMQSASAKG